MRIVPEWRGTGPTRRRGRDRLDPGSDIAPVDLADPEQALRLKAYVWADAKDAWRGSMRRSRWRAKGGPIWSSRMRAISSARCLPARKKQASLACSTHSVMWQYLPPETREAISAAMDTAERTRLRNAHWPGSSSKPNRFDLRARADGQILAGGSNDWTVLSQAHPHGAWVEWFGVSPPSG